MMNQVTTMVARQGIVFLLLLLAGLLASAAVRAVLGRRRPDEGGLRLAARRLALPAGAAVAGLILRDWGLARLATAAVPEFLVFTPVFGTHLAAWIVFWELVALIRAADVLLASVYQRRGKPLRLPQLLHSLLMGVAYGAALLIILAGVLKLDVTPVLGASALLTAILGFALQGVLGNLLAGISIHLTRTLDKGDWILVDGHEGRVVDTNWRETRIITVEGDHISIPNSLIAGSALDNYSKPDDRHRHEILIGAAYHDRPEAVIAALKAAALESPDVEATPEPYATVADFGDFAVRYRLRYWTRNKYWDRARIDGHVQRLIWYKFQRAGIEIPFPMSDVLLADWMAVLQGQRKAPPAAETVAATARDLLASRLLRPAGDGQSGAPGAPPPAPLFDEPEIQRLAVRLRRVWFTAGERLCRQGDPGESCYVVVAGKILGRVDFTAASGRQPFTFEIGPGNIFGEMSLFTGAPRTASGTFGGETELIEIDQDTFAELLALKPEFADRVAELVEKRAAEQREFLAHLEAIDAAALHERWQGGTLRRRLQGLLARGRELLGGR